MSVYQQASFRKFFGTAEERAVFSDALLGDRFFEIDTQRMKVWTGSDWVMAAEDALSLSAGSAVIGKVGIDQTTDEVTNNVQVKAESAYATTALAASGVVKNAAGVLYGVSGFNNKASEQYIQIFNATAVPADGVAPLAVIKVGAGCNFSYDFGIRGLRHATGICWANSSTLATKTIGAADCWLVASYK